MTGSRPSSKPSRSLILPIIGDACDYNPRSAIRFLNNLIIDKAIYTEIFPDEGDVNPLGAIAISRSLQQHWPDVYGILVNSQEHCDRLATWEDEELFTSAQGSEDSEVAVLANRIAEDPRLDALLFSTFGTEWLEDECLRVRCSQYLEIEDAVAEDYEKDYDSVDEEQVDVSQRSETAPPSRRRPQAAFMRPMKLSAELSEIVGKETMPRTEVTKKLWAYIKKHKLQDPINKRMINADDKLLKIFDGQTPVNMFEMTKMLSKHMK